MLIAVTISPLPRADARHPVPASTAVRPWSYRGAVREYVPQFRHRLAEGARQVRLAWLAGPAGEGDRHGFIARLIGIARDKGVSGYTGDGSSRWPAMHVLDAAHLFRLAAEQAPAGSGLHAVGDEGVPTRDIAGVIGRHLNLPVASVPAEDFGFLGQILAIDRPASSAQTRALLEWRPVQPGLIDDLDKGHYFA